MAHPHDRTVTRPQIASISLGARPWIFVVACGETPSISPARYSLDAIARVSIGRGDASALHGSTLDIKLPDPWMSSSHASIERVVGSWVLTDAGSKNGVTINGSPSRRAKLEDGDLVEIGSTALMFRLLLAPQGRPAEPVWRVTDGALAPIASLLPSLVDDLAKLRAIARSDAPVLLIGEGGVGRSAIASSVHEASAREGAFVTLHCGALAPSMEHAELLGVATGAPSSVGDPREGVLARAHRGTLFLDEVADLSPAAQAALLGALRARAVRPVGAHDASPLDLRVIASSRHDLDATTQSALRPELLAMLRGFSVRVPPLRARREDTGLFLSAACARNDLAPTRVDPVALRALIRYDWPGNTPEFDQCIAASAALSAGSAITLDHLPDAVRASAASASSLVAAPAVLARPESIAPPKSSNGPKLTLEGDYWTLELRGALVRLRDSDGVRYLAYLVERPGVDVHAIELATLGRGAPTTGEARSDDEDVDDGDAGPMLDAEARAAYKRRVESLRDVIEEATRWGDRERASKAQEELDAIARELARAVGLGGRDRKTGSPAERARVSVTMRVKATLKKIAAANATLGEHFNASVRTGGFCKYAPLSTPAR